MQPFVRTIGLDPFGSLKRLRIHSIGIDEYLISRSNGSNLAKYPSVVFKVFIDGREAAASPVMRILSPAWRFDIEIPKDKRIISIVAMDAGDGSREDYADWADAGFVVSR